jgi:hypothetical protein
MPIEYRYDVKISLNHEHFTVPDRDNSSPGEIYGVPFMGYVPFLSETICGLHDKLPSVACRVWGGQ